MTTALAALDAIFAEPGASVVIEEFLEGEEASFFALSDGRTVIPFGTAQDHKRVFDGDAGPNTGGMGAYSPAPIVDDAMSERVMAEIIRPTVAALARRGITYRGVLYRRADDRRQKARSSSNTTSASATRNARC